MAQIVNVCSILLNQLKWDFCLEMKPQHCLNLLHLTWLDTTNFVLYGLLESIDLMLLKLTRRAMKAIGSSEDCLGTADCIVMHRPDKVYSYG